MFKKNKLKFFSVILVLSFTFSIMPMPTSLPVVGAMGPSGAEASSIKTLGDLDLGDRVTDLSWEWEDKTGDGYSGTGETKPVTWIVAAKNHPGYPANSVTLLTEEVIGRFIFDNSTDITEYGYNHWGESGTHETASAGIRPWLNSTDKHSGEGFYEAFSEGFKDALLVTEVANYNMELEQNYWTHDKVFLPSSTEMRPTDSLPVIGETFAYFAEATGENWPHEDSWAELAGQSAMYWTRTPDTGMARWVQGSKTVGDSFIFGVYNAQDPLGVRPVVNLSADTSLTADPVDGVYQLSFSVPAASALPETLSESSLQDQAVTLTLKDSNFNSSLQQSGFTLQNAPAGLTIQKVERDSATQARVFLNYDQTNTMTSDISNFTITVAAEQLDISDSLSTQNIIIQMMTDQEAVADAKEFLQIGYASEDSADQVTQDLNLPSSGSKNTFISWQSSNTTVVRDEGTVFQPYYGGDAGLNLTASISRGSSSDTKTFPITVLMNENFEISTNKVLPARIYVDDEKNLTVTGTGFRAYVNQGLRTFKVIKTGFEYLIPSKSIRIINDSTLRLEMPAASLAEGVYQLEFTHATFGTETISNAFEVTTDIRYKIKKVEELVIKNKASDAEINELKIKGLFEEDPVDKGKYNLIGTDQVVTFNHYLRFQGSSLQVDTRDGQEKVTGDGRLHVESLDPSGIIGSFTLNNGDFEIDADGLVIDLKGPPTIADYLRVLMPVRVDTITFIPEGVRLSGAIDAGFQFAGKRWGGFGDIENLDISKDRMDLEANFMIGTNTQLSIFPIPTVDVGINTKIPRYDFGAFAGLWHSGKQGLYGFDLDFSIARGKLNGITLQILAPIPIPPALMQIVKLGGGVENLVDKTEMPMTIKALGALADLNIAPPIAGNNMLNLDPLSLGFSKYHFAAEGKGNLYGLVDLGSAEILTVWDSAGFPGYSGPGFEVKAEVNILSVVVGSFLARYFMGDSLAGHIKGPIRLPAFVPYVGGIFVGQQSVGVSSSKVWGNLGVLGIDLILSYFFRTNKFDFDIDVAAMTKKVAKLVKDVAVESYKVTKRVAGALADMFKGDLTGMKELGVDTAKLAKDLAAGGFDLAKRGLKPAVKAAEKLANGVKNVAVDGGKAVYEGGEWVAEKTADGIVDAGNAIADGVSKLKFWSGERLSLAIDVDEPFYGLVVIKGAVSNDIRVQKSDHDSRPPVIFNEAHPDRNAFFDQEQGVVYFLMHFDQIGEWAAVDWGWGEDIDQIPGRLDVYEVAPNIDIQYVLDNMIVEGANRIVDFGTSGRTLLEIDSTSENVRIFDPSYTEYPLEFRENIESWNAVYFADLEKVYAVIDIPVGQTKGWHIESDGPTEVAAYGLDSTTVVRDRLSELIDAPNRLMVDVGTTGTMVFQILGAKEDTKLFKNNAPYPLVFDQNSPDWNAYYDEMHSNLYVLAEVDQADGWNIGYNDHEDVKVKLFERNNISGMAELMAELANSQVSMMTFLKLTEAGSLLFSVQGGDENLEVHKPDGTLVEGLNYHQLEMDGKNYLYFKLDVAEDDLGQWEIDSLKPVNIEAMNIPLPAAGISLEDLVADLWAGDLVEFLPMDLDSTFRGLFKIEFDPAEEINITEDLRINRPDGTELALIFDQGNTGWNAVYYQDTNTAYVMTDITQTGRWQFFAPEAKFIDIYRLRGQATMANLLVLATEGPDGYRVKVDLTGPGPVMLAIAGAKPATTSISKPDGSEIILDAQNSLQKGDVLYVLIRVEDGDTGTWTVLSTGSDITLDQYAVDEPANDPVLDVASLIAPPAGEKLRSKFRVAAGSRWAVEVSNSDADLKIFRPDGTTEYELRVLPPDAEADSGDYNAFYNAEDKTMTFSLEADETGDWVIESAEMVEVQATRLAVQPKIEGFDFAEIDGENQYAVNWDIANPRAGTGVSITLITEAQREDGDFIGETLADGLWTSGETGIQIPPSVMAGTYYLVLLAENPARGNMYAVSDMPIQVAWTDTPESPQNLRLAADMLGGGTGNGEITLEFDDANYESISYYRLLLADEHGVVDYFGPNLNVEPAAGVTQKAILSGLETGQTYWVTVIAIQEVQEGEEEYARVSLPSAILEVYLPTPVRAQPELAIDPGDGFIKKVVDYQTEYEYMDFSDSYLGGLTTGYLDQRLTVINNTAGEILVTIANEQASAIELYLDEVLVGTESGTSAQFSLADLAEGNHQLEVIAINTNGDRKSLSERLMVDITAPYLDIMAPDSGEVVYKAVPNGVTISGTTERNAQLQINGASVTINDEDGSFEHRIDVINEGILELEFEAVDYAGNVSESLMQVLALESPPTGPGSEPDNADLIDLQISYGTLSPAFSASQYQYNATVGNFVNELIVTPAAFAPMATITVNGTPVASGSGHTVILNVGSNNIVVIVTAEDGTTTRTYTVNVTRGDLGSVTLTGPSSVTTGEVSGQFTLTTAQNVTQTTRFVLSTSQEAESGVFDHEAQYYLTIPQGQNSATFTYQNTKAGTGTHTITAIWHDGDAGYTGKSGARDIQVNPAAAQQLVIATQPPATATAGAAFEPQPVIHMVDQYGNLVTGDNSTQVTAAIKTGSADLQGAVTRTAAGGIVEFTGLRYEQAETITIEFTAGDLTAIESAATVVTTVTHAPLDHFLVESAGGGAISGQTAGESFAIRITAKDAFNNTVADFDGNVSLTTTSQFLNGGGATAAFAGGVLAAHTLVLTQAGDAHTITATGAGRTGSSAQFKVSNASLDHFLVEAGAEQRAGTSFAIKVTTQDQFNNIVKDYDGAISFKSSDDALVDYPKVPQHFTTGDQGVREFTDAIRINKTGSYWIRAAATADASKLGIQHDIVVHPAALAHFKIEGIAASNLAGTPTSPVVTAYDEYDNVKTDYTGEITFSSSDAQADLPLNYIFQSSDRGAKIFTGGVVLKTTGEQWIRVIGDTIEEQADITVTPAPAYEFVFTTAPPGNKGVGTIVNFTVEVQDEYGNPTKNHSGFTDIISVTSDTGTRGTLVSDQVSIDPGESAMAFTWSSQVAGSFTVTAAAEGILPASYSIGIDYGKVDHFTVETEHDGNEVAGEPFTVTITARDQYDNVITDYIDTEFVEWTTTATAAPDGTKPMLAGDWYQEFSAGVLTMAGFTLYHAGETPSLKVRLTDTSRFGTSAAIIVNPAVAASLSVEDAANPHSYGELQSVTVTARDGFGNRKTDYTGTITFHTTDPDARLPEDYEFMPVDAGRKTFTDAVNFSKTGSYWLTALEVANPSIRGDIRGIEVERRALIITADAKSKLYGQEDPELTYRITSGSLAGTDELAGGLTRVPGEDVGVYEIQQGALTAGDNYDITFVPISLTIRAAAPAPSSVTTDQAIRPEDELLVEIDGVQLGQSAITRIEQIDEQIIINFTLAPEKIIERIGDKDESTVIIPLAAKKANMVRGELTGQLVKAMAEKRAIVEVQTARATYTLPATEIKIETLAKQFGENIEPGEIKVVIEIGDPAAEEVRAVEEAARVRNMEIVAPAVSFKVKATHDDQEVVVDRFNNYVGRLIAIPENVAPSRITTGVVVNPDGTVSHVPTVLTVKDGRYYARINSLTNSTYSVIWNPREFADVDDHWGKAAVNDMGSRLIINGYDQDTFKADQDITRAEFTAIVVRALGLSKPNAVIEFTDVSKNAWYANSIRLGYEYKLISGYADGTFRPDSKITREEAMTIMRRVMDLVGMDTEISQEQLTAELGNFTDSREIGGWARESIALVIKNKIVAGYDGKLSPRDNITRAETAAIVQRILQKANLI